MSELSESKQQNRKGEKPSQIITIDEEGTRFELQVERIIEIMQQAEKINKDKVIILSVVGAFRSGKSFLLDLLIRYLRSLEPGWEAPQGDSKIPAWARTGGESLAVNEENPGFLWRPGRERATTGIWFYGRPFVIEQTVDGKVERVPLILMDTQGFFDFTTSQQLTSSIFGLSVLISSCQIYNIKNQIQENDLEQLNYFSEFAKVVFNQSRKEAKAGDEKAEAPLQSLRFLVRDWQNFDDKMEDAKLLEEMHDNLKNAMKAQKYNEETRKQINSAFQSLDSYLLPHPGLPMTKPNYDGDLKVIDDFFWRVFNLFLKNLFRELQPKRIFGKEVGPMELVRYIKQYAVIYSKGSLPQQFSLVAAMARTTNLVAKDKALSEYSKIMRKESSSYLTPEKFEEAHKKAETEALQMYTSEAVFGDQKEIDSIKSDLVNRILQEEDKYKETNKQKLQEGLDKLVVPIVAAVGAYLLDLLSDWVCDAWSETCRLSSRVFSFGYFVVFLVVGYHIWSIYKRSGSAAAGMSALRLAEKTIERVATGIHQVQNSAGGGILDTLRKVASDANIYRPPKEKKE